jgi:hypothetical protein
VSGTPDGYDMCPECGHHTSAFCGSCTVMMPVFNERGAFLRLEYCGCDCYKALHGVPLLEKVSSSGQDGRS